MKQVMFKDLDNGEYHGGILTDDKGIICGCCGGIIPGDEVVWRKPTQKDLEEGASAQVVKVYDLWVNLDEEICGDDIFEARDGLFDGEDLEKEK